MSDTLPKQPNNPPPLKSKAVTREDGATEVTIDVAGWRVDITLGAESNVRTTHNMVHIANTALDGADAGWCGCVYDSSVGDQFQLNLDGTERE